MNASPTSLSHQRPTPVLAYTRTARALHWAVAVLVFGMLAVGWYMTAIEDDPSSGWYFWLHKSTGLVVLALVLVRLLWRLGHRPAALPGQVPAWQVTASKISHWLLYASMLAMPLAGLTGSLFSEKGVPFFGWQLPRVFAPDHGVAEIFYSAHSVIAWVLVGLVSVHVLAALKHLLVDKDGVFYRMWFYHR